MDNYAEEFQKMILTDEWRSASIVYDKYRRKLNLELEDLHKLRDHLCLFSALREKSGKKVHKDILLQEASKFIKNKGKS